MMRFRTLRFYAPDDGTGSGTTAPTTDEGTTDTDQAADDGAAKWQGTITGENLEATAAQMFGEEITASAEDEPGDDAEQTDDALPDSTGDQEDDTGAAEGGGDEGAEGVESPPPADGQGATAGDQLIADVIDLGNNETMSKAEAAEWHQFAGFLRANPDKAAQIAAVLEGQPAQGQEGTGTPAPGPQTGSQPATLTPPEGLDLDDPGIRLLWEQHVAQAEALANVTERVQQQEAVVAQQTYSSNEELLNTARATYAESHKLSADDMKQIEEVTTRMQVLPAILAPFDPVTGAPRQVDKLAGIQQAFDMARWAIPEFRQRELDAQVEAAKVDNKRKKKLSSLGGSSGTSPRTEQVPNTPAGRREAMIQEVARIQNQGA